MVWVDGLVDGGGDACWMRRNEWTKAHELRPDKHTNEGFARAALRRLEDQLHSP